ncbi:hypothetical protein D3C85_654760 [compost metagenome]
MGRVPHLPDSARGFSLQPPRPCATRRASRISKHWHGRCGGPVSQPVAQHIRREGPHIARGKAHATQTRQGHHLDPPRGRRRTRNRRAVCRRRRPLQPRYRFVRRLVPGHPRPHPRPLPVEGGQHASRRVTGRPQLHVLAAAGTGRLRRHPAAGVPHQLPAGSLLVHRRRRHRRRRQRHRPRLWRGAGSRLRGGKSGRRRPDQLRANPHPGGCPHHRYLHHHPPLRRGGLRGHRRRVRRRRRAGDQHDPRHRYRRTQDLHRRPGRRRRPVPAQRQWTLHRGEPGNRPVGALHRRPQPERTGHRQPVQHQLRTHPGPGRHRPAHHPLLHLRQVVRGGAADPGDRPALQLLAQHQ